MKIALLLGAGGTGKSNYIIPHLTSFHQLLAIDHVRSDVLMPLRPLLIEDAWNRWEIWDALIPHFDVLPAFVLAIQKRYPELDDKTPILAEGGLLAHSAFRTTLLNAFRQIGLPIDEQRLFWIDPPEDRIFENRKIRAKKEMRPADLEVSLEKVRAEKNWYCSIAEKFDCERFADANDVITVIDDFLRS